MFLWSAEAGRIAKAIWAYTMNGEILPLDGAEKGIFPMILMTLEQDEERNSDISAKRSSAAKAMHLQANAGICKQMPTNASKCSNKNQNKNIDIEQESESESESFMADDTARQIQNEHDRILTAAEDAGFKMSNDVRAALIALYADSGLEKMLDGFRACVNHGAPNLAYLKAVLKGKPKQGKVIVPAQDFQQRSYDDVNDQMMESLARDMAAFKKEVG